MDLRKALAQQNRTGRDKEEGIENNHAHATQQPLGSLGLGVVLDAYDVPPKAYAVRSAKAIC